MKSFRAALLVFFLFLAVYIGSQGIIAPGKAGDRADSSAGEASPAIARDPATAPAGARGAATPASGTLPPSPQWASLEYSMSRDSAGLEFTRHAAGHTSVHGGGHFTQVAAGVRDASGRMVIQCFCDYTALDGALSGRAVPVPSPTNEIEYEVSDF